MTSELRIGPTLLLVLATALIAAAALALPGETVTTKYVNDLFVFLDGAWRMLQGQVPNRDFHSALGPMAYVIPAAGHIVGGDMGAAMPTGMALLIVAMAPAMAWIVASRLRIAIGAPFALYVVLLLAAPANFGEGVTDLSFAMFYNRIGWAALSVLLLLHLPPLRASATQRALDAVCAVLLVALLVYTKMTYAAVAAVFFGFLLVFSPRRMDVFATGCLVLLLCGAIELVWRGSAGHVADLLQAARVSGAISDPERNLDILKLNGADLTAYALFAALTAWRTRRLQDQLFLAFCAGAGFLLIVQNFQHRGVATLAAGAAVAAELMARVDRDAAEKHHRSLAVGAHLLLLGFLAPTIVHSLGTLTTHTAVALSERGERAPLPGFDGVRLVSLREPVQQAGFRRYFESLDDARRALAAMGEDDAQRTLVLDFVNPFTAGLGLRPPQGDYTWHHWGRTINEASHPPADELFRDVRVVLDPKQPIEFWTAAGMRGLYADHLAARYALVAETADWRIYLARPQGPADMAGQASRNGG